MAVQANFNCPERDKFHHCFKKLMHFSPRSKDLNKTDLNILLDQLNSLEYSSIIVNEQDGNQLLTHLCSIIPLHEDRLVVKLCQIAHQWKRKQMLPLTDVCLLTLLDYLAKAIQRCQPWTRPDLLRTLAAVLYENCDRIPNFHEVLLGKQGLLVQLIHDPSTDSDALQEAVLCLECLTVKPSRPGYLASEYVDICFDVFTNLLHVMPTTSLELATQCKIVVNCLRGIQNILQVTKVMPINKLGSSLAAVRAYMFFGLYSQKMVIPESVYPSPLTKHDVPTLGKMAEPTKSTASTSGTDNTAQKKSKKKKRKSDKQNDKQDAGDVAMATRVSSQNEGAEFSTSSQSTPSAMATDVTSQIPTWARISSSESEFSDTEGGQGSKLRSNFTKARQCALSCFYSIVKSTDKKLMFSYWSSFMPDSQSVTNMANTQTLFTIVLKDPSPKCRMGALASLSVLIDGTKMLLSAAEDRDDSKTATFTPFSMVLGSTIKEIHRCLLLALVSEDYPITLTQLIKCLGMVIANVPYHRMRPGLLSRIVKQIRHFINHRDPNVRVACLTCLGAMAGIQPPLMEICHIIQPPRPPVSTKVASTSDFDPSNILHKDTELSSKLGLSLSKDTDSGFGTSPGACSPRGFLAVGGTLSDHSGGTTPRKGDASSSGIQTPIFSDQLLQAHARDISWVVKLCVKNILPQGPAESGYGGEEGHVEPLPIRLESLQVLANLTKGYFPIIRNCVPLLKELVHNCYCDKDPVVRLHTAKLLDEFTQVLLQDIQNTGTDTGVERLDKAQVLEFWMSLLTGPIQEILQDSGQGSVRATTCDCIANIGDEIFTSLPVDRRIMCLTVVLGLANDEDRFVRAAAIRTLGVYVLYRSLREDVSFVADATSAILGAMEDKNLAVRVKAVWSLANLCDALALNREEGDTEFVEEFSELLLMNVATMATKACQDSDKLKANGVRSLGNILRYITVKHLVKEKFLEIVNAGIKALIKNVTTGAMKVRWNACYAVSNLYKNVDLSSGAASWNVDLLHTLCMVVKECKNFKVRINAAIALCAPQQRCQYGDASLYCSVWRGVIDAFSTAEDIEDFIDFRYRDSLTQQICLTVLHLVSVLLTSDLDLLTPVLNDMGDQLLTCMDRYYHGSTSQASADIGAMLKKAQSQLDMICQETLTESQSACLDILTTMCQQLATVETGEERPAPKSAFVQTYD